MAQLKHKSNQVWFSLLVQSECMYVKVLSQLLTALSFLNILNFTTFVSQWSQFCVTSGRSISMTITTWPRPCSSRRRWRTPWWTRPGGRTTSRNFVQDPMRKLALRVTWSFYTVKKAFCLLFQNSWITFVNRLLYTYSTAKLIFLNFGLYHQALLLIHLKLLKHKMTQVIWHGFDFVLHKLTYKLRSRYWLCWKWYICWYEKVLI